MITGKIYGGGKIDSVLNSFVDAVAILNCSALRQRITVWTTSKLHSFYVPKKPHQIALFYAGLLSLS
jgi:hypothetical protein